MLIVNRLPELRHLRYFVAVAEELHFGRAAARLHIAQPGLSQQIQALERELGVALLDRTRRRAQLTPAGRSFLDESRRLLVQVERAVHLARRAGSGEIGRLAIGATESATHIVLPPVLREYRRRYPDVELVLHEMISEDQVEALRHGEIDVAFVRGPLVADDLEQLPLPEERLAVVIPRRHALARRASVPLKALAGEPFVLHPTPPSGWAEFTLAACRRAGFEPRVVQTGTSSAVAVSFVAAELGVALLPSGLAEGIDRRGVVVRPISGAAPRTRLVTVYRKGPPYSLARLTPTARALIDIVRGQLARDGSARR